MPRESAAAAVLLTGGLATGKSTVAVHVGELLERAGAPGAVIDLDWLCWAWAPDLHDERLHGLLCANLAAVLPNILGAGARYLVLGRAVLSVEHVTAIRHALDGVPLRLVRLTASEAATESRLRARDARATLAGHLAHRAEFARLTQAAAADAPTVDTTERDPSSAAAEVLRLLRWPLAA